MAGNISVDSLVDSKMGMTAAPKKETGKQFQLSAEAWGELVAKRDELGRDRNKCENGQILSADAWKEIDPRIRRNTLLAVFETLAAKRSLNDLSHRVAIPTPKAAISVDPSIMVDVLDPRLVEMTVAEAYGREFLGLRNHRPGAGSSIGQIPVPQADEYIAQIKIQGQPYHTVISNKVLTSYTVVERGVAVTIDRWSESIMAWDELASQMLYISNGFARSINKIIWEAFCGASGAYDNQETNLQNVGGTGQSTILGINGANTARWSGVTMTAGVLGHQDFTRASNHIQSAPNPSQMVRVAMRAAQYLQVQDWAVSQKISFLRIRGRDRDLVPSANFDGIIMPVEIFIDEDIPTRSSLNCVIFAGPARNVGDFIEHQAPTLRKTVDEKTNEDVVIGSFSNAAKVWGYSNVAVGYAFSV